MNLIGLCGLARSGKDTAAAALLADGWERRAFADPLRQALYALDPYVTTRGGTYSLADLVDRHGWDNAKAIPDVRRLLQRLGTEVGRQQWGADVWVDLAMVDVPARCVFTDVRFPNEADAIRHRGGLVVRIERPGAGLDTTATAAHVSEALAFDVDRVIVNDGTLAQLHDQVRALTYDTARMRD